MVEQFQQGLFEQLKIDAQNVQAALAVHQPDRVYVLPKPLVAQLHDAVKPKPDGVVAAAAQVPNKAWKVWALFSPKRALGYMTRNVTGDLDPILAGQLDVFSYAVSAIGELRRSYEGKLSLSPKMKAARDLGVIGSSLTASEIPDVQDLPVFRRFFSSDANTLNSALKLPATYFEQVKRFNEFREGVLRYAAFLAYRKHLREGTLKHYGGARKETVDALVKELGHDVAAAHLARNLLGDYGNLTVFGDWMRKYVAPFWSWNEVNFKRYPRMAVNAFAAGMYGRGIVTGGTFAALQ